MHETRTAILQQIKQHGTATVDNLATHTAVSSVTVRHHLYALMADGLVRRVPLRHGVGRPQHGYSLTEAGQRQFPSRYHVLTAHLLSVLKNVKSEAEVQELLETIVRQLFNVPTDIDGLSPQMRLHQLESYFVAHDIPIQITYTKAQEAQLNLSCPYYYVSQYHPELCSVDEKVIGDMLHMPLVRTSCLLYGDKSCTFSIKLAENTGLGEPTGSVYEIGSD